MYEDDPSLRPVDDPTSVEAELAALGMTEADLDAALEAERAPAGLAEVWEPDEQMVTRVATRVEGRLADREALASFADLLGLGWFTLRAVLGDQNEP